MTTTIDTPDPFQQLFEQLRGYVEDHPLAPPEALAFLDLLERADREAQQRRQALVDRIGGLEARIRELELAAGNGQEQRALAARVEALERRAIGAAIS